MFLLPPVLFLLLPALFSALYSCFPIFYPAAILLGCKPSVMAGIIISGAIFGDNLAPISDTTILSASCQTYNYDREKAADIGGCVATRFKYSIIAGIISVVIYAIIAGGYSVGEGAEELLLASMDPKPLVMLIPVITMLIIAIRTPQYFPCYYYRTDFWYDYWPGIWPYYT